MIGSESGFVFGNPIAPLVINANFLPMERLFFMEFPQKIAVAPPSKMPQWWWNVKNIEIYFRTSAETNTFSVHNAKY